MIIPSAGVCRLCVSIFRSFVPNTFGIGFVSGYVCLVLQKSGMLKIAWGAAEPAKS